MENSEEEKWHKFVRLQQYKSLSGRSNNKTKETISYDDTIKCNCKYEQRIDGRFYCKHCGEVQYTVL